MALLLANHDSGHLLGSLQTVIVDELHSLAPTKRGDLLSLALARLATLAPPHIRIGLSATVAQPSDLRAFLARQTDQSCVRMADLVTTEGGAAAEIRILETEQLLPWAGHTTRYAVPEVYAALRAHRLSIVFVNTRSQAELMFRELWRINDENLAIALHHGSLDRSRRLKVEAAMAAGSLRAVVATSTLDLGIDWGDVDLVINIGAPKGTSRLIQRVGRANHRLDEVSEAILVPSNRFEVLESLAAIDAAEAGTQDADSYRVGAFDVLAQHIWGSACAGPFRPGELFEEVRTSARYAALSRRQFDRVVDFVATGGYALRSYDRYSRLKPTGEDRLRLAHPRLAQQYRMNVGTIVEAPMIKIRLVNRMTGRKPGMARALARGRVLGELEELFIEQPPSVTPLRSRARSCASRVWRTPRPSSRAPAPPIRPSLLIWAEAAAFHASRESRPRHTGDPREMARVAHPGVRLAADPVRAFRRPRLGRGLDRDVFRNGHHFLVVYPFKGRFAHQTLGMLSPDG